MPLDAHLKENFVNINFVTYNPYFLDQNYKSKFDTKNEVALQYRNGGSVEDLQA